MGFSRFLPKLRSRSSSCHVASARGDSARRHLIESLEQRTLLAATLPDGFSESEVAPGLFSPTAMAIAPDGSNRIFVTEQTGDVRVVKNGQLLTTPFARIGVTSF